MNKFLSFAIAALLGLALAAVIAAQPSAYSHTYNGDYHWTSTVTQPDQSVRVYLEDPELPRIIVTCGAGSHISITHTNDSTTVTCK